MKLYIILSCFVIVKARATNDECNGIIVKGVYHEEEVLADNLDRPFLLTVDYSTNVLYFSYSVGAEGDIFQSCYIDLKSREFGNITQVPNGFAQAIDQDKHEVYIGGSDGIYKYDHDTKTAKHVGANNTDIWFMFYKYNLYYTTFPEQILYTLEDGVSKKMKALEDVKVDLFIVDKDDYEVFTNSTGLYGQKTGGVEAFLYDNNTMSIRELITDVNGLPYVCDKDGIYLVNKDEKNLEKIADIDDAFGLAFDKDNNIIYSDALRVVRLKPKAENKCQEQS